MPTTHEGWRVSVLDGAERICGAGVLIAPDLVLTCAHVVATALPGASIRQAPESTVIIDFPTGTADDRRSATVAPHGWVPRGDTPLTGDLALLRLDRPVGHEPAALAPCGPPSGRAVRAFGHAHRDPVGRWATARLTGTAGPGGDWVQLNDVTVPGPRIERGYSGAGVVEESTSRVIGMIVGVDREVVVKGAWMMSMEAVAARLAAVAPLLPAGPVPARSIAQAQHDDYQAALVDALMDLDGLHLLAGRTELIAALDQRLDSPLGVTAGRGVRADLDAVVRACLEHPGGIALLALTAVVHDLFGDGHESDRFNLLAGQNPGRRLLGDEAARLAALLAELPAEQVQEAMHLALGPLGPRDRLDARDPIAIIDTLAGQLGMPGAPPLLVLLTRLAARCPRPESDALAGWAQLLSDRWKVPTEAVAIAAERPAITAPQRSYLMVKLNEDLPTPGAYLLTIVLRHDDGTGEVLVTYDDQPLGLQEIPGHIGTQLRRVLHSVTPVGELSIEFVLPDDLLGHAVDQFEVMLDGGLVRLGAAYPVVVRSGSRMHNPLLRRRWERRAGWVHENGSAHHPLAITWAALPAGATPTLEHRLRERDGYTDEVPVCLVLTWRVPSALARVVPQVVNEALALGVVALLWCRSHRLADQFMAETANQLSGLAVADLVRRVHLLRRAADGADNHVGTHVCLLWDDPQRLMPDAGLSAPV
ncbi:trypsin-like peptidase domain-containing protein [Actinoplanes sp. NPDC051851]|uniref:VMAP-C domain-containing protein n=1 Tax=Actinoplanes sp. NPDC051851 TaxID=3154753 RepID=UPI003436F442